MEDGFANSCVATRQPRMLHLNQVITQGRGDQKLLATGMT